MACPGWSSKNTSGGGKGPSSPDKEGQEDPLTYHSYLQLDRILDSQDMKCKPIVHDEHLFIVTHQAFELWFQQILYETDSITDMLPSKHWDEKNFLRIISRLNRMVTILKLCCNQFGLLETMTPRDFVDFRHALGTASGFQSYQFRLIEIRFGVVKIEREHNGASVLKQKAFRDNEREKEFEDAQSKPSLHQRVDEWLSIAAERFDFWNRFEKATGPLHTTFKELFNKDSYNESLEAGKRRFTYQAMQGALMISLYCDEPKFHVPFQLLQSLMDLDCQLMQFRYLHKDMVQRMIGEKKGTAGTTRTEYLNKTCSDEFKVFNDLLNLSTYFVSRADTPSLSFDMESLSSRDGSSG